MSLNYIEDTYIDPDALDVEWLGQAALAIRYGRHFVECKKKQMAAEENIKVIRAELIAEVNNDPDKCLGDGVKPTAANVEAYYRTHRRHKKAKEDWLVACYEANMAEVAKSEISFTRKAALEGLVKLHGQMYFAGPSVPRDLSQEWQTTMKSKNANDKVSSGMTRRPK